ncbi:MAG TPA: protein-disulfide reductase DsbD domain-containing protein [Candidatus Acidoferrum sp.]|nr:protein-disulfide reductase DsbD domain-containing protein [Candidatus Acidoferrum sp.]
MKRLRLVEAGLVFICCLTIMALAHGQIPSARDVVKPAAYASFDPVTRGKQMEIAVVMKIRDGYHVNARETTFDYLIPTDLKVDGAVAGLKVGAVSYPKGTLHKFSFAKDQPLNVYTDTVMLRVPVTVEAASRLGEQHLALKLRYQACSTEVCLPPVTLPLDAVIHVTSGKSHPNHPELFAKQ